MKWRLTGRWTTSGSGVAPASSGSVARSGSLCSPSLPTEPDDAGGLGIKESDSCPESESSDIETFLSRPHTLNYWEVGVSVTLTQRARALPLPVQKALRRPYVSWLSDEPAWSSC